MPTRFQQGLARKREIAVAAETDRQKITRLPYVKKVSAKGQNYYYFLGPNRSFTAIPEPSHPDFPARYSALFATMRPDKINPLTVHGKQVAVDADPVFIKLANAVKRIQKHSRRKANAVISQDARLVYFVGGERGCIKIGAAINVANRLVDLQIGSPIKLFLLATAPGGMKREREYHKQFASIRSHGEWFRRTPALLAEIDRLGLSNRLDEVA